MSKERPRQQERYPDKPFVSVVIPVYNDTDRLRDCLQALTDQTYPASQFEVLVVDNGSECPPPAAMQTICAQCSFLTHPQGGSYAARNAGIEASRGDVLAFIDSDCLPSKEWIEEGVKVLHAHHWDVVAGGRVAVSYFDKDHPTACELYETVFAFNQKYYIEKTHFSGAGNLFASREIFGRAGLFDASLTTGGDTEWGRRAYASGIALIYAPKAMVWHPARRTMKELTEKIKRVTVGQCRLARRGGSYRRRAMIKISKVFPSIRYKLFPVFRCKELSLFQKCKAAGVVFLMHYYMYWHRLIRIDCLWRTDDRTE